MAPCRRVSRRHDRPPRAPCLQTRAAPSPLPRALKARPRSTDSASPRGLTRRQPPGRKSQRNHPLLLVGGPAGPAKPRRAREADRPATTWLGRSGSAEGASFVSRDGHLSPSPPAPSHKARHRLPPQQPLNIRDKPWTSTLFFEFLSSVGLCVQSAGTFPTLSSFSSPTPRAPRPPPSRRCAGGRRLPGPRPNRPGASSLPRPRDASSLTCHEPVLPQPQTPSERQPRLSNFPLTPTPLARINGAVLVSALILECLFSKQPQSQPLKQDLCHSTQGGR